LAPAACAYLAAIEGTNQPATVRRKRGILRILLRDLGDVPLTEIDPALLDGYRIRRRNLVSGPSVNREMATLSHLYTWAQRMGLATFNPVTQLPRFPENTNAWQRLDHEQAERLIAAAGEAAKKAPHLQPLVVLALYTGLRKGELLGLNWGQVDIDRGTLEIVRQKNRVRSFLPLHARARGALLNWAVENEATVAPGNFVFSHTDGRPFGEVRRSSPLSSPETKNECASVASTRIAQPLSRRKTSVAKNAVRLLPSTNGGFINSDSKSAVAISMRSA
jgi:integrase